MNEFELDIKMSDKEMERIKEILTKSKGIRHYLLKTTDSKELDVVEYKEYEKLQQQNYKAIKYIENEKKRYGLSMDVNTDKHLDKILSILQSEEVKDND